MVSFYLYHNREREADPIPSFTDEEGVPGWERFFFFLIKSVLIIIELVKSRSRA